MWELNSPTPKGIGKGRICLHRGARGTKICANCGHWWPRTRSAWEASMRREKVLVGALLFLMCIACAAYPVCAQQIGKFVPIPANSDADHALTEINATTDPAQKLALIDKFAAIAQGDMAIVVDDQYVNYYIAAKNYDKAFEYGDKLFALDPDNFSNAINMVRAAREKGDVDKLFAYGEKAAQILQRYKEKPAPR